MKPFGSENRRIFTTGTSVSDSKTWIFSLICQIHEVLRDRRTSSAKTEITAIPVAVENLWSKKQSHVPGLLSLLAHVIVVAILIVSSAVSYIKPRAVAENTALPAPLELFPAFSAIRTGGGGGMKSPTPASKGVLPKASTFQLVPPSPIIITNMAPELVAEPTIIDLTLTSAPTISNLLQLGDPSGVVGPPSGGPGSNYGIGNGNDHGDGDGNSPSAGRGNVPGPGNGIVRIGIGEASAPNCPLPASEPTYTDDARRSHIQGTVILDVIVNKDGTVSVSNVAQKIGYGLDDEASRFVAKSFRCKPGTYQGQAVATPVRIDVNFHLY
jgi:periplasmic protein TonB